MGRVIFEDVVRRINVNTDRNSPDVEFYVGGEHIESNEFMIHDRGVIKGSTIGYKFHYGFKRGNILFMSRNPHLRKASMVDFDGVCSDSTYVVETKDESILLQKYLLLEMQSDRFWEWMEAHKTGGVNYLINYRTLNQYEFDLPSIRTQHDIVEKAWAAYRLKEAYKRLLAATDEMVKSQFLERFGNPTMDIQSFEMMKLSKLGKLDRGVSKVRPRNREDLYGGKYPFIQTGDISKADRYLISHHQTYSEIGLAQSKLWPKGTLCITIAANIAETAILTYDACFPDSVVGFIPSKRINLIYLQYWFLFLQKIIEKQAPQTAQKNINLNILSDLEVVVPPMERQEEFAAIVRQAEKSKFELKKAIEAIDRVIKSLING